MHKFFQHHTFYNKNKLKPHKKKHPNSIIFTFYLYIPHFLEYVCVFFNVFYSLYPYFLGVCFNLLLFLTQQQTILTTITI